MMKKIKGAAVKIILALKKRYPQKADMDLGNPEDSLIATIFSARTTDVQVLKMFPAFRKKFSDWESLARAKESDIAKAINTVGLYRNKAKSVKALAQKMIADYDGRVPKTMDELVTLPGVGRKTASCILSVCFHEPAVAVDTHVFRIAHRLGWSNGKTAEKVEEDIKTILPEKLWGDVNRTMVRFGREICIGGIKPKCWKCPVARWCVYAPKTEDPSVGG